MSERETHSWKKERYARRTKREREKEKPKERVRVNLRGCMMQSNIFHGEKFQVKNAKSGKMSNKGSQCFAYLIITPSFLSSKAT